MARYIDADKAIERLKVLDVVTDDIYGLGISEASKIAKMAINETPTADVAEVVRCEKCIYCRESDKTNRIFCTYHGDSLEFETYPNAYCSYGAQKSHLKGGSEQDDNHKR